MKYSAENMNIALVHDWLTNYAGGERVVFEISKLFPKAPIFTSVYDPEKAPAFKDKDVRASFLQKYPLLKSKRELLVPLAPFALEQIDLSKFDLVISSSSMASKGVITKPETVHICYCHTPSRYLWEPEVDNRASKGLFSSLRKNVAHKLRIWDRLAADRVDYFLANSKYVAKRIKKYYGRDSIVVYPPVDVDRFEITEKKNVKDYFLYVSRLVSYKRCDLVIDAFNDLGLPLKIIGRGPEKKSLQRKAKNNIEFLGFLSNDEVKKYYQEAKAFVFAAEEDFGIVPVEAMASGRPVIAYGEGGVRETVVEGETGTFFSEQTAQCLIDCVKNFDESKYSSEKIKKHAKKFSPERFGNELKEVIDKIVEDKFKISKL
jgi:glycosyltransferase involved in cell wall biosynthesis